MLKKGSFNTNINKRSAFHLAFFYIDGQSMAYFSYIQSFLDIVGKLKFQITNQQITIQTKFSGLKIEDIPK